jgi:hypothetical protein
MIHTCLSFAPIQLSVLSSITRLSGNRLYVLQTLIFVFIFLVQHDQKGLYNEYRLLFKKPSIILNMINSHQFWYP